MLKPTPLSGWLATTIRTAHAYWSELLLFAVFKLRHCAERVLHATEEKHRIECTSTTKSASSKLKAPSSGLFKPAPQYSDYRDSFISSDDGNMTDGSETDSSDTDDDDDDGGDGDELVNRNALVEALHHEIDSLAMRITDETKKRVELEREVRLLNETLVHMDSEMASMTADLAEKAHLIHERDATIKDLIAKNAQHVHTKNEATSGPKREVSSVKNLIALWAKDNKRPERDSQQANSASQHTPASPKAENKREATDSELQSWETALRRFIQAVESVDDIQQRQNESLSAQVCDLSELLALVDFDDDDQSVLIASTRDRAFRRTLAPGRELLEVYRVERELQQRELQTALSSATNTAR